MTHPLSRSIRAGRLLAATLLVAAAAACASSGKDAVPKGITEVDKFLFQKGTEELDKKHWFTAREYFSRIVDNYPQSPYRPDAKLGVGDTFLGEGSSESFVLAENEFREFLTFYPTNKRADYAQYKLGMSHFYQMHKPERDQSQTRQAIRELEAFLDRYPQSALLPEVSKRLRDAKDRLSYSEYRVGYFYYKAGWYPGAVVRFKQLLKDDPEYTNRDAVYYYLGESLLKGKLDAEARVYFDKLLKEFQASEYLDKAKERLATFKPLTTQDQAASAPKTDTPSATPAAATPPPTGSEQAPPVVQPTPAPTPPPPQP